MLDVDITQPFEPYQVPDGGTAVENIVWTDKNKMPNGMAKAPPILSLFSCFQKAMYRFKVTGPIRKRIPTTVIITPKSLTNIVMILPPITKDVSVP